MQIDINDFFVGDRYWSEFYIIFEYLPSSSKTKAAISMDDEMALLQLQGVSDEELQRIVNARAERSASDIELSPENYDITVEKLNQVIDSINGLRNIVKVGLGGKLQDSESRPVKRPKTKFEQYLDRRLLQFEKEDVEGMAAEFGF